MAAASVLVASACLSKPERPTGGLPGGDGGPDGGYVPDSGFLLRRQVAVGDLDTDGIDELVMWGNAGAGVEEQGQRPIIRLYWGGASGLTQQEPDIDMRFDTERPWYEVIDVAIEQVDSIVFLTAEDLAGRDSPPPHVRRVRAGLIPVAGRAIGEPVFRSQDDLAVSGYVDEPAPAFVVNREKTVGDESRLVFSFIDLDGIRMPTLGDEQSLEPSESTAFLWDEDPRALQEAFTVDDGPDTEDLVVVTRERAGRTNGDAGAGQAILQTEMGQDCARVVRGDAEYGTFRGLATCEGAPGATLIDAFNPSEPPAVYPVELTGSTSPTDMAIRDVAGDPLAPEIVTIEDGVLLVYGDLMVGTPVIFEWDVSMPVEDGYDLLAVGHFHAASSHQIYLFSSTDPERPPRCFEVDGVFRLVDCP